MFQLPTPTLTGGPTLVVIAASGYSSISDVAGSANAASASAAGSSIACEGGPSEVHLAVQMLHVPCMCMHITTYLP